MQKGITDILSIQIEGKNCLEIIENTCSSGFRFWHWFALQTYFNLVSECFVTRVGNKSSV